MKLKAHRFWAVCVCSLLWAGLALPGLLMGQAQTQPPQKQQQQDKKKDEFDTPYTDEEYAAYETATKEPDLTKRQQLLVKFMKDYPKSALKDYIVRAYTDMRQELWNKKQWALLVVTAEGYLAVFDPNDLASVVMIAESYRNLSNHAKFIEWGQKVYANKPTADYAYAFAKAYEALKDEAKYLEWGQKTRELLPEEGANIAIHIEFVTKLMQIQAEKKQLIQAAVHAQKLLTLLEKAPKPQTATDKDWKEYIAKQSESALTLIGESQYDKDKWKECMATYQRLLKFNSKSQLAYYRIGICQYKLDDPDAAIDTLAIAHILEGSYSKSAYTYLENLYKALHNNTTVGLNRVIDEARKKVPR